MGLLSGLTHAVVFFNTVEGAKTSGVSAMMKLCFGGDDDAIAQILYRTAPGFTTPSWGLPVRQANANTTYPIFTGAMGEEILAAVGRASDRLKKSVTGKLAGRTFRVTSKGVEEIKTEAPAAK